MEHILSLSYGKDSLACLGAIDELGWPLDRIIHAEIWAMRDIPGELPPMIAFKEKADAIIKERWGIEVEHLRGKYTYEDIFYQRFTKGKKAGQIYGFPMVRGPWCNDRLKLSTLVPATRGAVSYIGIAVDEPQRLQYVQENEKYPLVEAGWTEEKCRQWCEENDLLSPIYSSSARGGCWFCHNQGADQLRFLYRNYPEYWKMLLRWDFDSPNTFKADGYTVSMYDRRFRMEDEGLLDPGDPKFRWSQVHQHYARKAFQNDLQAGDKLVVSIKRNGKNKK